MRTNHGLIRTIDLRNTLSDEGVLRAMDRTSAPPSLDDRGVAFITAVKDQIQYEVCLAFLAALNIPPGYVVEKIAVLGGSSMAQCYQRAMEVSTARYKIYLHVDTYVIYVDVLRDLINLFQTYPRLGMVGIVGATQLNGDAIFWLNNGLHCYGHIWEHARPTGFWSSFRRINHRRLCLRSFRPFAGAYLPALFVDGCFMATQYDISWTSPANLQMGFDLYDHVQSREFIKSGLEVGIARQESDWCIHWGPLQEHSAEYTRQREVALRERARLIRQFYPEFTRVPAQMVYAHYRKPGRAFIRSEPESWI